MDRPGDAEQAVEVYGDAHALPFRSEAFDTVLCTHVLVHLKEPHQAIGEMARVLKRGGCLILSARQMWHVYTPQDYYRFTASGLRYLAQQHGLEVIAVVPVGGFIGRLGVKLTYWLHSLNRRAVRWATEIPLGLLILVTQGTFYLLDALLPTPDDVIFNVLVARRPNA
jgi:2-polyprenyl-3-methyl-5-hydroxy-6-metoxy-1,4-benzoquinol methylase